MSYRGVLGIYFTVWFMSIGEFLTNLKLGFLVYSCAWVRAIITIALLAQERGGQRHAAG